MISALTEIDRIEMADTWKVNVPLADSDPELHGMILEEKQRQKSGLEMIASENLTSLPVLECMGSCLHNKYSEGQPGQRYYGGNQFIDKVRFSKVTSFIHLSYLG